ncbi:unnamed protein product [Closterium sp. NIES-65]|nr:unnamed protein product [Closterium sp. NIES-65]
MDFVTSREVEAFSSLGIEVARRGLTVTGVPVGSDAFVERSLPERLESMRRVLPWLPRLRQPQTAACLLSACVSTRPQYLARTVPPTPTIYLPIRLGGFGIRRMEHIAPAIDDMTVPHHVVRCSRFGVATVIHDAVKYMLWDFASEAGFASGAPWGQHQQQQGGLGRGADGQEGREGHDGLASGGEEGGQQQQRQQQQQQQQQLGQQGKEGQTRRGEERGQHGQQQQRGQQGQEGLASGGEESGQQQQQPQRQQQHRQRQ